MYVFCLHPTSGRQEDYPDAFREQADDDDEELQALQQEIAGLRNTIAALMKNHYSEKREWVAQLGELPDTYSAQLLFCFLCVVHS